MSLFDQVIASCLTDGKPLPDNLVDCVALPQRDTAAFVFEWWRFILDVFLFPMYEPMFSTDETNRELPKESYITYNTIVSVNHIPRK